MSSEETPDLPAPRHETRGISPLVYELFVLGELMIGPMYGYHLHAIVNRILGPFRPLSWGTIYPLIRRLEQEGLTTSILEHRLQGFPSLERGQPRRMYAITPAGRERFLALMLTPSEYSYYQQASQEVLRNPGIPEEERPWIMQSVDARLHTLATELAWLESGARELSKADDRPTSRSWRNAMPSSTHTTLAPVHHRRNPALIRLLNRIPALLLRSPLHAPLSRRILLLTFTGRKSGKPYRLPVSYVQVGQTLLLTSDRPWWKKLHGGVSVHLRLRGQERTAVAEVVTDATRVTELYRTMLPKNPMQSRLLHIKLGQDGQPDEEDVRQALARCRRRGALS